MLRKCKRLVVLLLALVLIVMVVGGCKKAVPQAALDIPTAEPKQEPSNPQADGRVVYSQSPYLEDKGLPPVAERLPKVPKVVNEFEDSAFEGGKMEIGKYGGTMRFVNPNPEWNPDIFLMLNEGVLNTPSILGEEITPNIFEAWEANADYTSFTFKLREGLRWSDGEPVTMADVKFAIEDCLFNTELNTAGVSNRYRTGNVASGTPMTVEYLDDWSFKVSFDQPYGRFSTNLALTDWVGYTEILKPAHYLKKWHAAYGDMDEIKSKAEELSITWEQDSDWTKVFGIIDITNWELCNTDAIGFPSLWPWVLTESGETVRSYERNPYYYKVDASGQQLPYIDKVQSTYISDFEVITMSILSGEVDMCREDATLAKIALYKENEKNGFQAYMATANVDPAVCCINQTYGDDEWKAIAQNLIFRQALALGMDWQEIIDSVYLGYGNEPNLMPSETNPTKAQELLDSLGMVKGKDGMRTMPNGDPISLFIDLSEAAPEMPQVGELVAQQWKEIGMNIQSRVIDGSLHSQRRAANELQFEIQWNAAPMWRGGGWTNYTDFSRVGALWSLWLSNNGESGEEPPEYIKEIVDLKAQYTASLPGAPGDKEIMDRVYQIYNDNIILFQIGADFAQPIILNDQMGNIPSDHSIWNTAINIGGEILYYK